jgi:hypothetical protein
MREDNPSIFEEQVGHFWIIWKTREYMRARYGLVVSLLKIKSFHAVHAAADHLTDMLRLCHRDDMGTRNQLPHSLLRLGRDQDCYDFIKWWAYEFEFYCRL